MNKFLYSIILVLILCGCSTTAQGNTLFVSERNYDVGRSVDLAYLEPPYKIVSFSLTQDKYFYKWREECRFVYYVNKTTKVVEAWEFISSPDKCSMSIGWLNPW